MIIQRLFRLLRYHRRRIGFCCFCGTPCGEYNEIRTVDSKNRPTSWNCLDEECIKSRYGNRNK